MSWQYNGNDDFVYAFAYAFKSAYAAKLKIIYTPPKEKKSKIMMHFEAVAVDIITSADSESCFTDFTDLR